VNKDTPANEVNAAMTVFDQFTGAVTNVTPQVTEARIALQTKTLPLHAIKTRSGRGKSLQYVKHTYATRVIQDGLLPTWSFDIVSYEIFQDKSVLALCRFAYKIPFTNPDGTITWIDRSVTEAGNFLNDLKLPGAPAVAAAVSRGLVRCLMRMFGFSIELYEHEDEMTPDNAYTAIFTFAQRNSVSQERLHEIMQAIGITQNNIVDRFNDLFDAIAAERDQAKVTPFPATAQEVPQAQPPSPTLPVWQMWKTAGDVMAYASKLNLNVDAVKTHLATKNPIGFSPAQAELVFNEINRIAQDPTFAAVQPVETPAPNPAPVMQQAPAISPTVGEMKPVEDWKDFGDIKTWLAANGKASPEDVAAAIKAITDQFGPEFDYSRCPEYASHLSGVYGIPVPVAVAG
jgi:hypothetical protein